MEQLKIDSPESHDLHPPDQDDHEEEEEQLLNLTPEILSSSVLSHPGDSEPFDVFICSEAGKPIYLSLIHI